MRRRLPTLVYCLPWCLLAPWSEATIAQVLRDNGPLLTTPGNGPGGTDTSAVQTGANQTTTGYTAAAPSGTRVADDFVVPASGWLVTGIRLFAFQTDASPTDLGVSGVSLQIRDAAPGQPGSDVVFSYAGAATVSFSNLYRVVGARVADDRRPIARISLDGLSIALPPGTYWLDWQVQGTRATGPYVPPVTFAGQAGSGNAMQFRGGSWAPISAGAGEELPFILLGGALPDDIFSDGFES